MFLLLLEFQLDLDEVEEKRLGLVDDERWTDELEELD